MQRYDVLSLFFLHSHELWLLLVYELKFWGDTVDYILFGRHIWKHRHGLVNGKKWNNFAGGKN